MAFAAKPATGFEWKTKKTYQCIATVFAAHDIGLQKKWKSEETEPRIAICLQADYYDSDLKRQPLIDPETGERVELVRAYKANPRGVRGLMKSAIVRWINLLLTESTDQEKYDWYYGPDAMLEDLRGLTASVTVKYEETVNPPEGKEPFTRWVMEPQISAALGQEPVELTRDVDWIPEQVMRMRDRAEG